MFTSTKTALVLVTEDPMVEIAVRHLLGAEHDTFELSSSFGFQSIGQGCTRTGIGIVLVDLCTADGLDQLPALRLENPGASILCWCGTAALNAPDLREKCDGVISRLACSADLITALLNLVSVNRAPKNQGKVREINIHLTYREGQLVALLARGYKNKEIAACLGITAGTVKVYLSTLFKKTGAKDRFELTLFGMKNSLYGSAEVSGPVPVPIAARRAISRPLLKSMRLLQPRCN